MRGRRGNGTETRRPPKPSPQRELAVRHNITSVRVAVRLSLAAFGVLMLAGSAVADADALCGKCGKWVKVPSNWIGLDRSGKCICEKCRATGAAGTQHPGANVGYNGPRNTN